MIPDKRYDGKSERRPTSGTHEETRTRSGSRGFSGGLALAGKVSSRLFSILLVVFSIGFFVWGLFFSGKVIFLHSVSAEDVTRGFDYGPIWIEEGPKYRARLGMVIPQSGKFWETSFSVLDLNKAEVGKETLFLATTQPEFAPGKRTIKDNYFTLSGDSGWHFFRFQQIAGAYPAPGAMGAPVASLEIRAGVLEPKLCYAVLILGFIIGGIILFLTR